MAADKFSRHNLPGYLRCNCLDFFALWLNDWSPFEAILGALAIMFAALCVYAGLVWTIGNSIKLLWRLTGRFRRERDAGKLTGLPIFPVQLTHSTAHLFTCPCPLTPPLRARQKFFSNCRPILWLFSG